MRRNYGIWTALILALLLGLLLAAGPASAGNPFAGNPPSYGWHGYTTRVTWFGQSEDGTIQYFNCISTDPRGSGVLSATIDRWWVGEDGYLRACGSQRLDNAHGYWICDYWEHVFSDTGLLEGARSQGIAVLPEISRGYGDYANLIGYSCGAHSGAGVANGWITKGYIENTNP